MGQIDFTRPLEVLARVPDSTIRVIANTRNPVRDMQGLILTPEVTIAEAPELDVLLHERQGSEAFAGSALARGAGA